MAGTMGRLSVGVTGLQTNQYALNTTAHNLMNTQTDGYSRQQVLLTDRTYHRIGMDGNSLNKTGLGVVTAEIKQTRDTFADAAYRKETGRLNFYKAQYETVSELENYFGELEGQDFNTTMNDLWLSLQEMQKESNSIVTRSSFIATSLTFIDRTQSIRESLTEYQNNLNEEIRQQIDRINKLAYQIKDMNEAILRAEASGIENANDYRDIRNKALDELSGLVKTEAVANDDGTWEVYIENRCMVTRGKVYEIEGIRVSTSEQYNAKYNFTETAHELIMPVWQDDQTAIFNIDKLVSTETDSDIGSLKGLMMSRGYFSANHTDVPVKPDKPSASDFDNDADYQAAMADYQADLVKYNEKLDYFTKYVEPYTITNLQSQYDVLVNALVTGLNDILCPNREIELEDGSKIMVLDDPAVFKDGQAGIGMGVGKEYAGTELFIREHMPRYTEQEVTYKNPETGALETKTLKVYNAPNENDRISLYTTGNITVNGALLQDPSLLPLSRISGEEAQEVVDAMLELWHTKFATVSPNSLVECNYMDYYAGMMEDLANRGYTYDAMVETEQQTIVDLDNYRQTVVGVSSDEELSNMIKFQNAYNASSRYINTVSEMIEYLIEKLG